MRNGDYSPDRLESQHDAANLLCQAKIDANPESSVGVLTMANTGVKVLASPTDGLGKLLSALVAVPIGGSCDILSGIQVAQLALKHRKNQAGQARIVAFVGSPLTAEERALTKLGKTLKKHNIGIDILSFGEIEDNQPKLQALIDAAKSGENCHLVTVPAGVLPSDVMVASPILYGGDGGDGAAAGGGGGGAAAAGGAAEFGGVDPNMDPELALALRVSMEEERARLAAAAAAAAASDGATPTEGGEAAAAATAEGGDGTATSATADETAGATPTEGGGAAESEEDLLAKALAMSMAAGGDDEDAAMQLALQMSMQEDEDDEAAATAALTASSSSTEAPPPAAPLSPQPPVPATVEGAAAAGGADAMSAFLDPAFVNELLSGLPGVDPNDPKIQAAMAQIQSQSEGKDGEGKEGDKKSDEKK